MEKKGKEKEKEKRGKGSEKRGKGKKKQYQKKKKQNYITHHESGEGNLNDISFLVFLNIDNITFPSCLGGREINMIPKKT